MSSTVNLVKLVDQGAADEVARVMQICNACRYCEGFCAVFPAMERRRTFSTGDAAYLANLCHHCGACYHACQYAPPHEFGVNVPQALATLREDSYIAYAWPGPLAGLFRRNGLVVGFVLMLGLALVTGVMLALISPHLFWGVHRGEGAFYVLMPHYVMAGIPGFITAFSVLAMIMGWRRYWRHTGARWGGLSALRGAVSALASLRHLGGEHTGKGEGCPGPDETNSRARQYYHHATFYGFMMCFASTSLATAYHYLLGREAPYGYLEPPVLLGTIGGIVLCIGTAGLFYEKQRMAAEVKSIRDYGMDYAFIAILFLVSFTGLVLLAVRETSFMGLTLAIHLGAVYALFLIMPYSKFVHGLYRFAALLADEGEKQR